MFSCNSFKTVWSREGKLPNLDFNLTLFTFYLDYNLSIWKELSLNTNKYCFIYCRQLSLTQISDIEINFLIIYYASRKTQHLNKTVEPDIVLS